MIVDYNVARLFVLMSNNILINQSLFHRIFLTFAQGFENTVLGVNQSYIVTLCNMLHFFAIILLLFVNKTNGVCTEEGVMVVCETVEDFQENEDLMWKDVMIKSDVQSKNFILHFTLEAFQRVESLAIVGKTIVAIYNSNSFDTFIKVLTFYDNKIHAIGARSFTMRGCLNRLRLANNQIEELKSGAFAQTNTIKSIDLSNNLLNILVEGTFTDLGPPAAGGTEIIYLKNNKINYIEANTFPKSLRILNLDNNQLTRLDKSFTNLTNLQMLYLNHNKLQLVPDFRSLKALQELELSHNEIRFIAEETFANLPMLRLLDLSHNELSEVSFLDHTLIRGERSLDLSYLDISLAFNRISQISTNKLGNDTLKKNLIIFYGNPWDCSLWPSSENFMTKAALKRSECDLKLFNGGTTPYCVSYNQFEEGYTGSRVNFYNDLINHFSTAIKTKPANCELTLGKTKKTLKLYRLHDMTFPCSC